MNCPHCGKPIFIEIKTIEVKPKVKKSKDGKLFCQICCKEIVAVDVDLKGQARHFEPEQIAWFSQKEFGKNICWSCQNDKPEEDS